MKFLERWLYKILFNEIYELNQIILFCIQNYTSHINALNYYDEKTSNFSPKNILRYRNKLIQRLNDIPTFNNITNINIITEEKDKIIQNWINTGNPTLKPEITLFRSISLCHNLDMNIQDKEI
jgi:hypothetical protein